MTSFDPRFQPFPGPSRQPDLSWPICRSQWCQRSHASRRSWPLRGSTLGGATADQMDSKSHCRAPFPCHIDAALDPGDQGHLLSSSTRSHPLDCVHDKPCRSSFVVPSTPTTRHVRWCTSEVALHQVESTVAPRGWAKQTRGRKLGTTARPPLRRDGQAFSGASVRWPGASR